jgi:glutamate formiminotransferase
LEDCAGIAHTAGEEIARRFGIPVYFYGAAARRPEREALEAVRRAGYEQLKELGLDDPARTPDVGEPRLHPTAGATLVGARPFLIAFNVNLDSADRSAADQIARAVRASSGGLPGVKAMGVLLRSRSGGGRTGQATLSRSVGGQAQVSMNLTDLEQTSMARAYRVVEQEAARLGIGIHSSEIVGLVPQRAVAGIRPEELKLADFLPDKILEFRIAEVLARRDIEPQRHQEH